MKIHHVLLAGVLLTSSFFPPKLYANVDGCIGTPHSPTATKVLLCGSGELGKELVIELQRLGIEVIAVDRYAHAPAMQVAHRSYVISMLDGQALRDVVEQEQPDIIVPEIEAIDTQALMALEQEGYTVIPNARATHITMNRQAIRRLAAEELGLKTSPYLFADTYQDYCDAISKIGYPCVIKPIMSSSGKGQTVVYSADDREWAWKYAQEGARGAKGHNVIIEGFIDFDYEITLLTIRCASGTLYCEPIGHTHVNGEYITSWQPHPMSQVLYEKARFIAQTITDALGGRGVFGVELFIKGDDVYFSEVSPRPHDTGMVTLISQDISEFALHARAILGLPILDIKQYGPAASAVLLVEGDSDHVQFGNLTDALSQPGTTLRLFGKPEVHGHRRMGVALASAATIHRAREKASAVIDAIKIIV
jgi:phosphoribosylglycinamide formyltransferase 2